MAKSKYVFGDTYWVETLASKNIDNMLGRFADEALPKRRKKVLTKAKRVTRADLCAIETFETKWLREYHEMEMDNE
jgi:hypothetical protein